jgi:hypothetical protein
MEDTVAAHMLGRLFHGLDESWQTALVHSPTVIISP